MPRYEDDLKAKLTVSRLPITVGQYIQRLRVLNGDKPLTSMKFLLDFPKIISMIDSMEKAFSTKTSYLTAICAVLSMYPKYNVLYKKYVEKTMVNVKQMKGETDTNEKNDKQKDSIVPLADIIKVREDLHNAFHKSNKIDAKVWLGYTGHLLLALYTCTPPRRNRDYSQMIFVEKEPSTIDKSKNYYVIDKQEFIFCNYKTASTYGEQHIKVPADLVKVLSEYIETYKQVFPDKKGEMPLLVHFDGEPVHAVNGITRILNKVIGKKIGSSALRHIYLSDKFGNTLKEMKLVASEMSHDLDTQKEYIKTD
jgi:hypothetical protein